jgi:hypothetical protein
MCAVLVYADKYRMETSAMSGYVELTDTKTMMATLFKDGVAVSTYKMETCDRCSGIRQFDKGGYVVSDPKENMVWFCKECR